MGCCLSGGSSKDAASSGGDAQPLAASSQGWQKRERVDRSLLIVADQEGVTVGRLPGQLNGRQFRIRDCKNCVILVLDYTETVTVDNCTDCQILIAPSRGSVYIRECTDCRCVIACQQFRVRDCKKCSVSLYSATQPVIESSSKIKFSCFQCSYPQLKGQFESVGLSVFNNSWSTVHDFDRSVGDGNWTIEQGDNPVIIEIPSEGEFSEVGVSFSRDNSVVPLSIGPKQRPAGERCVVAFFASETFDETAQKCVGEITEKGVVVVLTKKVNLQEHDAQMVFSGDTDLISRACKGSTILFELTGENCVKLCKRILGSDNSHSDSVYVSPSPEQGTKDAEAFNSYNDTSLTM